MRALTTSCAPRARCSGTSLVEAIIASTLFVIVLLSAMSMIESGQKLSRTTVEVSALEDLAQQMLFKFEKDLANASGHEPETELTSAITAGQTETLVVSTTTGFPPFGDLILDRGQADEERVSYASLDVTETIFQTVTRGMACTGAQAHLDNATVTWAGLAVPIADQTAPDPSEFEGRALEDIGPVFFRGSGAGFSFRIPVDPNGGSNPLNGDDLFWGAEVPPVGQTTDGWMAYYFAPKTVFDERVSRDDLNRDGDLNDIYDIGQIRRVSWNRSNPALMQDIAMGPSRLVQEQCNWGSDLNGDGFDDPIFLWDPDSNLLHIRLMVLGSSLEHPLTRLVESTTFLRNEPEL